MRSGEEELRRDFETADALRAGAASYIPKRHLVRDLVEIIHRVWTRRADRYSEQRAELLRDGRGIHKPEMYYIGG